MDQVQRLKLMECPAGPVDMVLDTDAYNEIDDQYAISYAINAPEKLHVRAFYAAPFFSTTALPARLMEWKRASMRSGSF